MKPYDGGARTCIRRSADDGAVAQAALALPMLCFPQVLFGGAIVPVDQMATPGRLMSLVLSNRHAFDVCLIALASFAVVLTLATVWVLDRRSAPGASRR